MNRSPLQQLEVAAATRRYKVSADVVKEAWRCVPDSYWNDPNHVVERKLDGHRFKLHVMSDGNRLDSRRISDVTGAYVEKTDNVPHIRDSIMCDLAGTVFDGEICAGKDSNSVAHALGSHADETEKSSVKYVIFDILFFKGLDVRMKSDKVRRTLLELCFNRFSVKDVERIELMPRSLSMTPDQKKAVLVAALEANEEGVMMKDITKPYGSGWTKIKKKATFDVVVMGYAPPKEKSLKKGQAQETETKYFKNGWIGAIIFGQYVNGTLVECGQTSGFDDSIRKAVSENKESFLGKPFEIEAQERFSTGKFRHPRFIRWRDDKSAFDCVYRPDEV